MGRANHGRGIVSTRAGRLDAAVPGSTESTPPSAARSRWQRFEHWLPWLAGAVAAGLAAKSLVGAYADLGIYLDVAREFGQGGIDIHRARPNAGPFVYPHCAALPFVLLHGLFGDAGARWAWSVSLGLATVWLLQALRQATAPLGGLRWWQWAVFGVLFQRCIAQNLTHGQLSLWVGTFVVAGSAALVRGRDGRAGLWLGLAAALKLTPGLFLLALPLMGRTRAALAMLTTIVVAVLLLPWPFCGTAEHVRHLQTLWHTIHESLTHPEQAAITQSYAGPSVAGALDYLLQARPLDQEGHTVHVLDVADGTLRAVKLGWAALLGAGLLGWFLRARRLPIAERLAHQASAVAITMSLFAPLLRVYHLAAAMLPFALFCRGPRSRRDLLWHTTAAVLLLAMTLRQRKLLGEGLWRFFDGGAFLHLGIVLLCVWLWRQCRTNEPR